MTAADKKARVAEKYATHATICNAFFCKILINSYLMLTCATLCNTNIFTFYNTIFTLIN
jgi:hypothetical protein